jgi:hypothetical protein
LIQVHLQHSKTQMKLLIQTYHCIEQML